MPNLIRKVQQTRAHHPQRISECLSSRARRPLLNETGRLFIIAADHPARGALAVRKNPIAMADRHDLLTRLIVALSNPKVDGILATPDIIEDLAILGVLESKLVVGSLNRSGLAGSIFEIDDRVTAYHPGMLQDSHLDMTKLLLRIDLSDSATSVMLERTAYAISASAKANVPIMVEPFLTENVGNTTTNLLDPESVIKSIAIATALGNTSAYSWLKIPVVAEMERVMNSTTLPVLLLGGDVDGTTDEVLLMWQNALALPGVRGLVAGRSLLYPDHNDVASAVDIATSLVHPSS